MTLATKTCQPATRVLNVKGDVIILFLILLTSLFVILLYYYIFPIIYIYFTLTLFTTEIGHACFDSRLPCD